MPLSWGIRLRYELLFFCLAAEIRIHKVEHLLKGSAFASQPHLALARSREPRLRGVSQAAATLSRPRPR